MPWRAPGWIGNGTFHSHDMTDYYLPWPNRAKQHNLTIDHLGGWNEKDYDVNWYVNLKAALHANGYSSIKLVGATTVLRIAYGPAQLPRPDVTDVPYQRARGGQELPVRERLHAQAQAASGR